MEPGAAQKRRPTAGLRGRGRKGGREVGQDAGALQQPLLQRPGQHPRDGHQGHRVRRTRNLLTRLSLAHLYHYILLKFLYYINKYITLVFVLHM